MSPLIGPLAEVISGVMSRVWPDPAMQAEAQRKLAEMVQNGELAKLAAQTDLAKAQIAVNQVEAGSPSLFVSGARPFILWTCGLGLAMQFIVSPLLTWGAALFGKNVVLPALDMKALLTPLFAILGLGAP